MPIDIIRRGNLYFCKKEDLFELIKICQSQEKIFGYLNAFILKNDTRQEVPEFATTFDWSGASWKDVRQNNIDRAIIFHGKVMKRKEITHIEFEIRNKREWMEAK